jgi:hypothetical protein
MKVRYSVFFKHHVPLRISNWFDYETMMQEKFGKDLTPHRVKYRVLKK